MLEVLDKDKNNISLPIVDFHTHIGKVKIQTTAGSSHRKNNPKDILALYTKLLFELHKRLKQTPEDFYVTLPPEKESAKPLYPFVENLLNSQGVKTRGWLVDHVVTFPFNDIFHTSSKPKFVKSNRYIRSQIFSFDYSFRFIPFCRCDPRDKGSIEEVIQSVNFGMRGLKLHPMSQGWIEEITSIDTKEILKTAGNLGIPTIFDVPNKSVAQDITEVSEDARKEVSYPINVVLGHSAFDYSSPEVFECLTNREMLVETSGMRGMDVEIFFRNVMQVEDWNSKIVFGSDHNYFSVLQAADFITFLLSRKFEQLLDQNSLNINPLTAAARILGGNALRIIPSASSKPHAESKSNMEALTNLTSNIPSIYSILKKHLTNDGCYATVDIGYPDESPGFVQILTIGRSTQRESFILSKRDDDQVNLLIPFVRDEIFEKNHASHLNNFRLEDLTCREEFGEEEIQASYDTFTETTLFKLLKDEN